MIWMFYFQKNYLKSFKKFGKHNKILFLKKLCFSLIKK